MLQPLDVVKTRLQVQDGLGSLPRYGSTMHAFRVILQNEGWRALYSGIYQLVSFLVMISNQQKDRCISLFGNNSYCFSWLCA